MANLIYGNITGLSENDIKTIAASKPADKLVLFGKDDVSFDDLTVLNGVAATIEFTKIESEAFMYFILGANSAYAGKGTKVVFLSNIEIPEQFAEVVGSSVIEATRKKSTRKSKAKTSSAEKTVLPAKETAKESTKPSSAAEPSSADTKSQEADGVSESDTDKTPDSSPAMGVCTDDEIWVSEGAKEGFAKRCGLPENYENRDEIIEYAASVIHANRSMKEAMKQIADKYSPRTAEFFKENIRSNIIYFNGSTFKAMDI